MGGRLENFVELLTAAQPVLYARIRALLPCREAAADVLQETNLTLWRKRGEFVPGTNFLAWASQVARYHVLNQRRAGRRGPVLFDDGLLAALADRQATADLHVDALRRCLDRLPAEDRDLLLRRYRPGGSVQEMAAELGQSANAVSQLLFRLRERLLRCMTHANPVRGGAE